MVKGYAAIFGFALVTEDKKLDFPAFGTCAWRFKRARVARNQDVGLDPDDADICHEFELQLQPTRFSCQFKNLGDASVPAGLSV